MDVYAAIDSRQTIRDFAEKPVPDEIVYRLIDAGLKAPTNDHMRRWEFVVVNDKEAREKLLRVTSLKDPKAINNILDKWGMIDKVQRVMYQEALPHQYSMLYNSGCLILPFFQVKNPLLKPRNLSALNDFASIWCCIENILIAAASEGIFGVTRIPMANESEHVKSVLGHPDDYVLPCYIALGYPGKNAKRAKQNTVSAKSKVHFNSW